MFVKNYVMKQTAVECLIQELQNNFAKQLQDMYSSNPLLFNDIFLKAKEAEQQKLKSAYQRGKKYKKPLKDSNPIK
jgi:hypothetical protein